MPGAPVNSDDVKCTISESIHGPIKAIAMMTAMILGTNVSVVSWIWVAAWKILTATPITRVTMRMGIDNSTVTSRDRRVSSRRVASFMTYDYGAA